MSVRLAVEAWRSLITFLNIIQYLMSMLMHDCNIDAARRTSEALTAATGARYYELATHAHLELAAELAGFKAHTLRSKLAIMQVARETR